jgi:hypothetical protein
MGDRIKARKRARIVLVFCALMVGLLFWPLGGSPHRVAPRTSPPFDGRPKSDELVKAAGAGDLGTMKKLLDSGASPNAGSGGDDEGVSALSAAASSGQLSAVKLLLDRGADVNADDFWGGNALVGASLWGNVEIVRLLVAHGADPNMEDDSVTALDYASHQLVDHQTSAPIGNYKTIVAILKSSGGQTATINRPIAWLSFLFSRMLHGGQ